jgi:hypothetical protein
VSIVKSEVVISSESDILHVVMQVEKTVFTVIKDWLMVEGSSFHDMFSLPAAGSTPALAEGATITNPIILKQTTATSFKAF